MKRLALLMCLWPCAVAAQDPFRLDPLVVTATARPMPLSAVPAAVTVLEGDALRARGIRTVADALREVPGASLTSSGPQGSLAALFMRGGENNYVQVLVDGVQVNEPGGSFDFGDLVLSDVERIEIVRGPTSVLYGSDAVTGVVHIVTRRGEGRTHGELAVGASTGDRVGPDADGGYTATDLSGSLAGSIGRLGYDLTVARTANGGLYAFNNGYTNLTASGGARFTHDGGVVALTARGVDAEYEFPTNGAGALVDRNQSTDRRSGLVGLDATQRIASGLDIRVALSAQRFRSETIDRPDDAADTLGTYASNSLGVSARRAADVRLDFMPASGWTISTGAELEKQTGETAFASESSFGPFEDAAEYERTNRAAYAQLAGMISDVSVTAGGRVDDNDRFGNFFTWRVGAAARPARDTRVHVAAGTGFKEPTFFENYATGFVRGNPALYPETSRSWEAGVEQILFRGRARIGATWFDQRFEDLILYLGAAPDPEPNYVNVGSASASGLETSASLTVGPVVVDAAWTHLRTEVDDQGDGQDRSFLTGRPLLRRPSDQWSLSASWQLSGAARVSASALHVGRRHDLDFSDPVEFSGIRVVLPSHTTFDVGAEVEVRSGILLNLAVRNVTDEAYDEIANFRAAGRTFSIGARAAID